MKWDTEKLRLCIYIYLLCWFIGSFWAMGLIRSGSVPAIFGLDMKLLEEYGYYAFAGAIGGTLYALRIVHEKFDNSHPRYLSWYAVRPILCAGAAMMMIILFKSGIMLLQVGETITAKVGIAFLVGYGYGKFMDKLNLLTETLLNGKPDSGTGSSGSANGGKDEDKEAGK